MEEIYRQKLSSIVSKSKQARTHQAKLLLLNELLRDLFSVNLEELLLGIEKGLKDKVLGVIGRIDLLYAGVVFELKTNLEKEIEDAENELIKYFNLLKEKEPKKKYIGIVTDVVRFIAYKPVILDGKIVNVEKISEINIAESSPAEAILWLDSYIFSQPQIRPSAIDLKYRYGVDSPTYSLVRDELNMLWKEIEKERDMQLKYQLWEKNMEIVYGSQPTIEAFIDQTYLITLVKLIVYFRLSGDQHIASMEKIQEILSGKYFSLYGISNLIEEDFFTWILNPKIAKHSISLFYNLSKQLSSYDFSQIDEDFFKEIYQDIVEKGERHRIGEYYTPEWLSELIIEEIIKIWEKEGNKYLPRVLDPACGSGTFLCNTIRKFSKELEETGKNPRDILEWITQNVVGMDINPLAVIIARANYIISLGKLLKDRKQVFVPIYLSNSIRPPEITYVMRRIAVYHIIVKRNNGKEYHIQIPVRIANDKNLLNTLINSLKISCEYYIKESDKELAKKIFEKNLPDVEEDEKEVLKESLNSILHLIDEKGDSIWIFLLNNIYAPNILSSTKVDIIVGNPPWISMRYLQNKEYQDYLKKEIFNYGLLNKDQDHLFTHMEVATLFFVKCSDMYLKDNGYIAFVMPRSVLTGAFHHANFQKFSFKKPKMELLKIFDCEDVSPLFNVPSCVLIAKKSNKKTKYPLLATRIKGRLPEKNVKMVTATHYLIVEDYLYEPPLISGGKSIYYSKVKQGATIVPRTFWFIDFITHPTLGTNVKQPLVQSSKNALKTAKNPWRILMEGNIEADFIYATILGGGIVPFGFSEITPVILPLDPNSSKYSLLDVKALKKKGYVLMAEWLEKAQRYWEKFANPRSLIRFPRIIDRLDYNNLLTIQNPKKRYVVLYNTSGTNLVSCVIDRNYLPVFKVNNSYINPRNFVAESETYFYETNNEEEAYYLSSILNSDIINETIKPYQPRGLFGARHIHRRPFMFPIPNFDKNNALHIKLAELGKKAHQKVAIISYKKQNSGRRRKEAKEKVTPYLEEINKIVTNLIGGDKNI